VIWRDSVAGSRRRMGSIPVRRPRPGALSRQPGRQSVRATRPFEPG
jgi:hypothetical protein